MTINERIAMLRQREGLSQKMFGRLIGRTEGYVSKVESGKIAPPEEIIRRISDAFGVEKAWLTEGEGMPAISSVAERIRTARKARHYTQGELAEELGCCRNTIGLVERGIVRLGEELIQAMADKLWIDRGWLLTGKGSMEREELTPIYELLRNDPAARQQIKEFIAHIERKG